MARRLPTLLAVLAALLAVAPAAASAAIPANVKRVVNDYRNDGRIDPCRHSTRDLRDTLKAIQADTAQYAPDFPEAIEAAIEARASGRCDKKAGGKDDPAAAGNAGANTTGSAPGAPAASGSKAPLAPAPPATPAPPVPPAAPAAGGAAAAVPAPPAPAGAGITPGPPPAAAAADPDAVLTRSASARDGGAPIALIGLGALLALGLLAAALALALRHFGWGEERLAPTRHAWSEAGFRAGGTWQDFTDWVRLGR